VLIAAYSTFLLYLLIKIRCSHRLAVCSIDPEVETGFQVLEGEISENGEGTFGTG